MKTKIICILVMTLLIATTLPAIGVTIKTIGNETLPPVPNGAVDQEQTTTCHVGMQIRPPYIGAQSFKPSKEDLTNVQLWLFKAGTPPDDVELTVTIKTALDGTDLTIKTINADDVGIADSGTWVPFNFDDITVTPEETYYIVAIGSDGTEGNCYVWLFDIDDKYTRGEAWFSNNDGVSWKTIGDLYPQYPDADYCFKTYFKESRNKAINTPILDFLKNYPNLFTLLQRLFQRLTETYEDELDGDQVTGTVSPIGEAVCIDEGCTPGYWKKNPKDQDGDGCPEWPGGYHCSDYVYEVFSLPVCFDDLNFDGNTDTLMDALKFHGGFGYLGKARNLLRHAVAALLNSAHPCIDYAIGCPLEVIDLVHDTLMTYDIGELISVKNMLDEFNNAGCPCNAHGDCPGCD